MIAFLQNDLNNGADRVVVPKDGREEVEGRLEDQLETCQEMKELWLGELS